MESVFFGFNYPFYDRTFVLPPQTDERLIKNDILQLLLTSPGERVRKPDFGTLIRRFSFQPLDADSIRTLKENIEVAIKVFEPRVTLKDVIITTNPDDHLITVSVLAAINNNPNRILEVEARLVTGTATRPAQQSAILNG